MAITYNTPSESNLFRYIDDETSMTELEANVRSIEKDGLLWGRSQLVEIGYGIKKLQINAVVDDEKVFVVDLQGEIEEDEDHVQSTDVVRSTCSAGSTLTHLLTTEIGGYAETLIPLRAGEGYETYLKPQRLAALLQATGTCI